LGPARSGVGWDLALMGLARYLASGAAVTCNEAKLVGVRRMAKDFMAAAAGMVRLDQGRHGWKSRPARRRRGHAFYCASPK